MCPDRNVLPRTNRHVLSFFPYYWIPDRGIRIISIWKRADVPMCLFNLAGHTPACARAHMDGCAERAVPHGWTRAGSISRPVSQTQDRNWPQIARGEPGSCELPSATWPAPAASGNSARQKRARQPRGCAHTGCARRHVRLVRDWMNPALNGVGRRHSEPSGSGGGPVNKRG